jgi:hypothetical protein
MDFIRHDMLYISFYVISLRSNFRLSLLSSRPVVESRAKDNSNPMFG